MDLKSVYRNFISELSTIYTVGEASAMASMVFEAIARVNKMYILSHGEQPLDPAITNQLTSALARLKAHVPVQYVLEEASFYNLIFKVSPAVLIPRPETEELVRAVIDHANIFKSKTAIDIGTGSGCIPVSIKKKCPEILVTAIDVSSEALAVARENAARNEVTIVLQEVDFLDEAAWETLSTYDIIVSNPPYIPQAEKTILDKNVTAHEPGLALFVPDNDHLIFYKKIARFADKHLNENGKIFMEVHENYANEVARCFQQSGFTTAIVKDFYDKERIVTATRCQ